MPFPKCGPKGGEGGEELAREVVRLCENGDDEGRSAETFEFAYGDEGGIAEKIEAVAKKVYRADGVDFTPAAKKRIEAFGVHGLWRVPGMHGEDPVQLQRRPNPARCAPRLPHHGARGEGVGWALALWWHSRATS